MGKASFNKKNRREHIASGCFECRALEVAQAAFDEALARRGVRLVAEPGCTISSACPECGQARSTNYHGLDDAMRGELANLLRMINRDHRWRSTSDEVQRLQADFSARYQERNIMLYGLVWLEALQTADERLRQFFREHAEEFLEMIGRPPLANQGRPEIGED